MTLIAISDYLRRKGQEFPKPGADGHISCAQYNEADLPMVVSCTHCHITFCLTVRTAIDEATGELYCDRCRGARSG